MSDSPDEVFHLPDVGEGLTEAEVVRWHVQVGDVVEVNQIIVEIETAKAVVELPSPFAGTVSGIHVAEGQTAPVGSPLISVSGTSRIADREPVLVGYGVRNDHQVTRRPRTRSQGVLTKPPVRKLAKDLGVDLGGISATGVGGIVTRNDVLRSAGGDERLEVRAGFKGDRVPVRGVQRSMADAMVRSAFTAPHVTEWIEVDVSGTLALVARMREHSDFESVRVTPLTIVAAAVIHAASYFGNQLILGRYAGWGRGDLASGDQPRHRC